ncbi:MAG: hypothetical protein EOM80_11310 [Erysipelotrichia bacterium]|nr:hypothetical protein [Erysipelotrichia bacterium]
MRRRIISVMVLMFVMLGVWQCQAQPWKVAYGDEKGKVAVFNSKTDPKFAEDAPFGPMAFRIVGDSMWLLDSVGGKLYNFNAKNELKASIAFSGLEKNSLLEDFALVKGASAVPETVWFADAADCSIRKVSIANSKELLRIGGNGSTPGKFLQISQLEVDAGGRLYVGDCGRNVISVFTTYGELIRELPWQNTGFVVDKKGRLHLLVWHETSGYLHRIYSQQGQLIKSLHIGLGDLQNARIWSIREDGAMVVSFIPAGGFKGTLKLLVLSEDSRVLKKLEFTPPGSMNRFIEEADQKILLAVADFFAAPEGEFSVKSIEWDVTK